MKILSAAMIAVLLPAIGSPVAAQYLDQSQTNHDVTFSDAYVWTGQGFRTTHSNVSGVGAWMGNPFQESTVTGNVTFELWDDYAFHAGANLLASATTSYSIDAGWENGQWFDVFWGSVAVTPNSQLFLRYITDGNEPIAGASDFNPYHLGEATWGNSTLPTNPPRRYDLAFRTYTDEPGSVTPEPVTMVLVGSGLAGIAARRRRRNNAA